MTLAPLPPVGPEAPPVAARAPEAADASFAERLADERQPDEDEAPRAPAQKQQTPEALVNWAALIPAAEPANAPAPQTLAAPAETLAPCAPTPEPTPAQVAPEIVTAPMAGATEQPGVVAATPEPSAPAEPLRATAQLQGDPSIRTETNAAPARQEIAAVDVTDAAPAQLETAAAQAPKASQTQATQDADSEASASPSAPSEVDTPASAQAPPTLAAFTPPPPAARQTTPQPARPDAATTEEITPLRADREAPTKPQHLTPPSGAEQQQAQTAPAPQQGPNQAAPREAAPTPQQAQAPAPAIDPAAAQPAASVASAESARAQTAPAAAAPSLRTASPAAQVAQQIVRRVENGATTFDLRLDPPELGRVEVRLEMSRDHRVVAHIVADDASALQHLVRSAREIESALQSAGLELTQNGLSFDLADRGASQAGARDAAPMTTATDPTTDETVAAPARALMLERWRGARVDMTA
ncbi:MAG: flagellar hook-length control protein FliK [Hyphomonadaceae bacterium]|nr:flagellar hook-length control protein FliK [Hyphomonadaceae bacterium]